MDKFYVGGIAFDTANEARVAEEELQVIQELVNKRDINNPKVAKKILRKPVVKAQFKTEVGRSFVETLNKNAIIKTKSDSLSSLFFKTVIDVLILLLIIKFYNSMKFEILYRFQQFLISPASIFVTGFMYLITLVVLNKNKIQKLKSFGCLLIYITFMMVLYTVIIMISDSITFIKAFYVFFDSGFIIMLMIQLFCFSLITIGTIGELQKRKR